MSESGNGILDLSEKEASVPGYGKVPAGRHHPSGKRYERHLNRDDFLQDTQPKPKSLI